MSSDQQQAQPVRKLFAALASTLVWSACAYAVSPVYGGLYTKMTGPWSVTSAQASTKMGKACANSILGLVATGDASIEAAKRAGNITAVSSVDFESTDVLFLYARFCTIVRGN